MGISKSFEQVSSKLFEKKKEDIFFFNYENKKFWLKKARKTSSNVFHKVCSKIFTYDILIPVENKSPKQSILFETNKLNKFLENNISVPEVVFQTDKFFVMGDSGLTIYTYLKKDDIKKDEFYYYLDKTIQSLAKIHNKGFYHGGAQTRNFTYKDGKVFAIDFEESFDGSHVDLKTLQFRDLFLFLLSMTKIVSFEVDYLYIINNYINLSKNKSFIKKLKKISNDLNFLISLNNVSFIHNFLLPKDVKGFCHLLEVIKKI